MVFPSWRRLRAFSTSVPFRLTVIDLSLTGAGPLAAPCLATVT